MKIRKGYVVQPFLTLMYHLTDEHKRCERLSITLKAHVVEQHRPVLIIDLVELMAKNRHLLKRKIVHKRLHSKYLTGACR